MSQAWSRANWPLVCGRCGAIVSVGVPILEYSLQGLARKLVRCQACVGEAPPELPPLVARGRMTKRMTPLSTVAADVKLKQAGER